MGSTGEKADGPRGDKRRRKKKASKRKRKQLRGRVSGFALTGNTARTAAEPVG